MKNIMPAVLVTGGAGYIGSHAVLALLDAGVPVVVLDNLTTGMRSAVDPRAVFVEGNVGDPLIVTKTIIEYDIKAIMHFAASVIVAESVAFPIKYYKNNTCSSLSLVESAISCGIEHFIFSSTAATYGIPERIPVRESDRTLPINPYGMSKLMTEAVLADVSTSFPMNHCALRYFNVAGADPKGRVGQSTVGATHLIKVAVESAIGKREKVVIYGNDFDTPDGTGIRDYIHVSDLADAHVAALSLLINNSKKSYTLNCGYGRGVSVLEVLDAVERASNTKIKRVVEGRRSGDPDCLVADNSAILEILEWKPTRGKIDQIVADSLNWELRLEKSQKPKANSAPGK